MELSVRAANICSELGIKSADELATWTEDRLLARGASVKSVEGLKSSLAGIGMELAPKHPGGLAAAWFKIQMMEARMAVLEGWVAEKSGDAAQAVFELQCLERRESSALDAVLKALEVQRELNDLKWEEVQRELNDLKWERDQSREGLVAIAELLGIEYRDPVVMTREITADIAAMQLELRRRLTDEPAHGRADHEDEWTVSE
jgi:hypothetical protein